MKYDTFDLWGVNYIASYEIGSDEMTDLIVTSSTEPLNNREKYLFDTLKQVAESYKKVLKDLVIYEKHYKSLRAEIEEVPLGINASQRKIDLAKMAMRGST